MSERAAKSVLVALVLVAVVVGVFTSISIPISFAPIAPEPLVAPLSVRFSHPAGFYNEDFYLELTSNHDYVEIFYTTDGSPPKTDGTCESTQKYTKPILVEVPQAHRRQFKLDMLSIRAVAVTTTSGEQATTSREFVRNFITSLRMDERFSENTLVFALNSDPHGLHDHHDGIFVAGIDRERFIEETGNRNPNPPAPANYNRRGRIAEREVHVEIFDSSGQVQLSQNAGMRVKGGWSRASTQKSLELYARNSYSEGNSTFEYDFFRGATLDEQGNPITSFRRIRLRNNGNDREFGNLRDELSHTLFAQAGFPDTQQHTPAVIFLNGELYGFSWLKTPRTEDHWQRRYGGKVENFEHIGDGEGEERVEPEHFNGNERATADWLQVVELARAGLTNEMRWEEFQARICLDNLLKYYALQIYINNVDWPNGNMEMWRYFPEPDENLDELHPFLADGKWRFIAQDLEFAWNLYNEPMVGHNTIANVLNGTGRMRAYSELLKAVLERDEMRTAFANVLVQLMEEVFQPANVLAVIDELSELSVKEISFAVRENLYEPHNQHWPSDGSMEQSREHARVFARQRPQNMRKFIQETLGVEVA